MLSVSLLLLGCSARDAEPRLGDALDFGLDTVSLCGEIGAQGLPVVFGYSYLTVQGARPVTVEQIQLVDPSNGLVLAGAAMVPSTWGHDVGVMPFDAATRDLLGWDEHLAVGSHLEPETSWNLQVAIGGVPDGDVGSVAAVRVIYTASEDSTALYQDGETRFAIVRQGGDCQAVVDDS